MGGGGEGGYVPMPPRVQIKPMEPLPEIQEAGNVNSLISFESRKQRHYVEKRRKRYQEKSGRVNNLTNNTVGEAKIFKPKLINKNEEE